MNRRVVITGLGSITAGGHGAVGLRQTLRQGRPLLSNIERFNGHASGTRDAGQVQDFKVREWMKPMLARQMDRGTHFAFAAFQLCLQDAGIETQDIEPLRTGIMLGNAIGGMDFGESQMYAQRMFGPQGVSTYQAIAWFYAAAIGQISIGLGIKGYSKAFVADRISSLNALGQAFRVVQEGRADLCLTGGCEAPLVPFVYHAMECSGRLSASRYLPFDHDGDGFLLGEGACFLAFEEYEHAVERGATIYGEVLGYASTTDPTVGNYELSSAEDLARAVSLATDQAGGGAIDLVAADGCGRAADDLEEIAALKMALGNDFSGAAWTAPKATVGELYGAGNAVQAATAALALRHQETYPLVCGNNTMDLPFAAEADDAELQRALIVGRANGGMNAALVLGTCPAAI